MRFGLLNTSQLSYFLFRSLVPGGERRSKSDFSVESISFKKKKKILVVVPDNDCLDRLRGDLEFFCSGYDEGSKQSVRVSSFPSWDILPFEPLSPGIRVSSDRISAMLSLTDSANAIVVASAPALAHRIVLPRVLQQNSLLLKVGDLLDRDLLVRELVRLGYVQHSVVEDCGEMAVRGAVVDFFPRNVGFPIRVEFFRQRVDSLRRFDVDTQRSQINILDVLVLPVREFMLARQASGGLTLWPEIDQSAVQSGLRSIRERAAQWSIPASELKEVVSAVETGVFCAGLEHQQPFFVSNTCSLLDYCGKDATIVVYDEGNVKASLSRFEKICEEREDKAYHDGFLFPPFEAAYLKAGEVTSQLSARIDMSFDSFPGLAGSDRSDPSHQMPFSNLDSLVQKLSQSRHSEHPFAPLVEHLHLAKKKNRRVMFAVGTKQKSEKLKSILESYGHEAIDVEDGFGNWWSRRSIMPQAVSCLVGGLSCGFCAETDRLEVISDQEVFFHGSGGGRTTRRRPHQRLLQKIGTLQTNDFVVHIEHGIGLYRGLQELEIEGNICDFLHLEFADQARLYVPVYHLERVQKYVGAGGRPPTLSKLGLRSWDKTRKTVKEKVAQLAGELVSLYARRSQVKGFSFGEVNEADWEFAGTFPYQETPDQEKAIQDVLIDMASLNPMDRLVCGDVGYGKTEVAMRAAFKSAHEGKQVALLVPTTILAEQHFATFSERFSSYPIKLACLSRFQGREENARTLRELAEGKVDIIVGTHRLLQRDVRFRDLGLVIIDEEHRFGVAQKERLKKLKCEVDVLALTATPIPRTLHMSLMGIRDLSVIETAPCDRQVIQTFVSRFDWGMVREAALRELNRQGQVFFVYNKVKSIAVVTEELRQHVPEARIEFAHGQMRETELESIMRRFVRREIDILVCTTIVESGLDIPAANTIIIYEAHELGLAELYQLRGRVGRSSRRAYAYLLIREPATLTGEARKRLNVLQSLDDLGVGFRLALQDMEIRGAGNLLGQDQSGQVNAVGFELYSSILKDAVMEIRRREGAFGVGNEEQENLVIHPEMNLGFAAHIPSSYIPDMSERLLLFQRLVEIRDADEGRELFSELEDRFGRAPIEAQKLIELMIFRALLKKFRIVSASLKKNSLKIVFHEKANIDSAKVISLVNSAIAGVKLQGPGGITVVTKEDDIASPLALAGLLEEIMAKIAR